MNTDVDWPSVYTRPRPFDPYLIPLPIRMGRAEKGNVVPPAIGNLELIKVHVPVLSLVLLHLFSFNFSHFHKVHVESITCSTWVNPSTCTCMYGNYLLAQSDLSCSL